MTYHNVFIGVGSNIEPEVNIPKALSRLTGKVKVINISTFFETKPVGSSNQNNFYNGMFQITTDLEPAHLKKLLREVEGDLGRVRVPDRFAPRIIDLDIVAFEDFCIDSRELTIPDQDIFERPFVALLLFELAPNLLLPPHFKTLKSVIEEKGWGACLTGGGTETPDNQVMTELPVFTEYLRNSLKQP